MVDLGFEEEVRKPMCHVGVGAGVWVVGAGNGLFNRRPVSLVILSSQGEWQAAPKLWQPMPHSVCSPTCCLLAVLVAVGAAV